MLKKPKSLSKLTEMLLILQEKYEKVLSCICLPDFVFFLYQQKTNVEGSC
jgi:predicted house-cleaning NTP pyrophosphatase (Maf/HAM1 superfamily)